MHVTLKMFAPNGRAGRKPLSTKTYPQAPGGWPWPNNTPYTRPRQKNSPATQRPAPHFHFSGPDFTLPSYASKPLLATLFRKILQYLYTPNNKSQKSSRLLQANKSHCRNVSPKATSEASFPHSPGKACRTFSLKHFKSAESWSSAHTQPGRKIGAAFPGEFYSMQSSGLETCRDWIYT